jgi:phosphoribosylaminoimidazole-succinocarboxamide synthase
LITRSILIEGSGKKVFEDGSEEYLILEFKDYLIDKMSNKKTKVKNKGSINASISVNLFEYLNSYHISNHFEKKNNDKEITVQKLDMIPLEILIRNYAAGKFCKTYDFKEGEQLKTPVLEFYLKDEKLKKPPMCESLIYAKDLASLEDVLKIKKMACKTNAILKTYFERRNLNLIDIQLEFGKKNDQIILADEISLDTCTIIDAENNHKTKNNVSLNKIYQNYFERIVGEN